MDSLLVTARHFGFPGRCALVLLASVVVGCGGGEGSPTKPASDVVSVLIGNVPADGFIREGNSVQLTATPRDASGNPLTGREVKWGTSNAAVATVSSTGWMLGVGDGTVSITATSEGALGTVLITVRSLSWVPPGPTPSVRAAAP